MNVYSQLQLKLIQDIEEKFKKGESPSTIVEPVADYVNDDRICLTSLSYLPEKIVEKIQSDIINPLKTLDSRQYFYNSGSIHITVQNIRTISDPPLFTTDDIEKTREVFKRIIPNHPKIRVTLKRLFELPTSFGLCAFTDQSWEELVMDLRNELVRVGVPDNKIYSPGPVLANATFCRYTTTPNSTFMQKIKELKDIEIGSFEFSSVKLVTTNAVDIPEKTTIIDEFELK